MAKLPSIVARALSDKAMGIQALGRFNIVLIHKSVVCGLYIVEETTAVHTPTPTSLALSAKAQGVVYWGVRRFLIK